MSPTFLLEDPDYPENRPLTRFRSLFSLRNGIFSPLERLRLRNPDCVIVFAHPDAEYEADIARAEGLIPARGYDGPPPRRIAATEDGDGGSASRPDGDAMISIHPWDLLEAPARTIESDLQFLLNHPTGAHFHTAALPGGGDPAIRGVSADPTASDAMIGSFVAQIIGSPADVRIHEKARLGPGVVISTEQGPVILDSGVEISPFSYLEGPLYVGRNSRLDNVRLTGGCVIGHQVRLGGEVENCVINDFSNKHHEGFVGHSVLGSWVNLGALTTTSDLKNNYGEIRLTLPGSFLSGQGSNPDSPTIVPTGRIKFGALIGDCVKTAIGTMLTTGSVLDAGANIFRTSLPGYVPPFSWGDERERYELSRFLADCEKIFARRGEKPSVEFGRLAARLHRGV